MNKITKQDWKFTPVDPDAGFNAERNKLIIKETIAANERQRRLKQADYKEQLKARTEAVAQYLKSIDNGTTTASVLKYFGRKEMTRLRGEEIKQSLLGKLSNAKKQEASQRAKLSSLVPGRVI